MLLSCAAFGASLNASSCSWQKQPLSTTDAKVSPIASIQAIVSSTPTAEDKAIPKYDHIFVVIEENKGYSQIIGNPNAPNLNQLAKTYGLASNFYGMVHPSEANYITLLGGSTFGIHDDDAYYCQSGSTDRFCSNAKTPGYASHTVASKSLLDQLEQKGLTWKGYFEDLPAPGSKAVFAPSVIRALYAVKHNGFMSFKTVQDDPDRASKIVPLKQLTADLQSGKVPNYSHIIFNQCHEMHGLPECGELQRLIRTGDTFIEKTVEQITHSTLWSSAGNNAIIITWDEDNNPEKKTETQGCCGYDGKSAANFGGGHVATIVITNHGPRGVIDPTPYNHNSLLRTTENVFGIYEYLNGAGDSNKGVKPMTPLFSK
ncbi:phosphoesterase [Stenomitos frigidus ULC18]|uniref:Phosphoesterase n=1 Tax=Stenomitos frigidus ULC18 TaxID=2107698 RepID=A0A2T1E9H8_9CYAN|nr:phosphoesterase [Stenomitos frigidus ULC18]